MQLPACHLLLDAAGLQFVLPRGTSRQLPHLNTLAHNHNYAQATAEMWPGFDAALRTRDAPALRDARLEAASNLLTLYGDLRAARVRPSARQWLLAGLYSTLELVADADEALAEDLEAAVASVNAALAVVEAASPGSDLHVQLAARAAGAARRVAAAAAAGGGGPEAAAAAEAAARCERAHVLRYGPGLAPDALQRLVALSEQLGLSWLAPG